MDDVDRDPEVVELNEEISWIQEGDELEGLKLIDESGVEADLEPIEMLGQTNRVKVFSISCADGASSSLYTPEPGWRLNVRLGFYRANGARLGLSRIYYWDGAVPGNTGRQVRVSGYLPAGTKQVRGFWWYGQPGAPTSAIWWNLAACNC